MLPWVPEDIFFLSILKLQKKISSGTQGKCMLASFLKRVLAEMAITR